MSLAAFALSFYLAYAELICTGFIPAFAIRAAHNKPKR
jgi:hypothetical protein